MNILNKSTNIYIYFSGVAVLIFFSYKYFIKAYDLIVCVFIYIYIKVSTLENDFI